MPDQTSSCRPLSLRRGDRVRIRNLADILATLDAEGKHDGLPFMPEMIPYCGRELTVYRRAHKVFHDRNYYMGRLHRTVLLEDLRCNGAAHDGCAAGCLLLWKEAWLERAETPASQSAAGDTMATDGNASLITVKDGRFFCQATQLTAATTYMPWWDPRQYIRDLLYGESSVRDILAELGILAYNKLARLFGCKTYGAVVGCQEKTVPGELNLQPGELVEVKSLEEIKATLDSQGKNRGLGFGPEMRRYCGKRLRVGQRVDRMILEWTGEMRAMSNTVTLENVLCHGIGLRRCPRSCHHLWREVWLRRVTDNKGDPQDGDARVLGVPLLGSGGQAV